jgi:FdrA protein
MPMTTTLHTLAFIQANLYQDSVALMRVAQRVLALPEVVNATLQMGTTANKEILQEAGLLTPQVSGAGPSDIMVVVQARTRTGAEAAMVARNLGMAVQPGMNLAQISVPGAYAAAEAMKALQLGLNVFLFSDNVALAQEVALKQEAVRRGLLVMGPDCGTAIIGGVPLGFANVVRRGSIGLVAASGTGLQEVTTQIHHLGGGISHAIGTGGRDVYAEVGGATMLQGIALLARDAQTKVIVVLSKPPAPAVTVKVLAAVQAAGKPAVLLFLGARLTLTPAQQRRITLASTLVDAAAAAVKLAGVESAPLQRYAMPARPGFAPSQRYLRALYSGGTYAAEALTLWAQQGLQVWSNVALDPALALPGARRASREHTALDLGDDAFTVGRPHPMIDQAARIERLRAEAADASVRVILLDVVIGWGAHADPAGELAPVIADVKRRARKAGRELAVIGFVCGTEDDPQRLAAQEAKLQASGMVLAGNSANAAWLAARWLR